MVMLQRISCRLSLFCGAVLLAVVIAGSPAPLRAADSSSNPELGFVELYAGILRSVDNGRLDRSVGRQARELNAGLQKEILALDARIGKLKAAAATAEGSRRDELLDELVDLGGRRERVYAAYQRKLERLVSGGKDDVASRARPEEAVQQAKKEKDEARPSSKRTILFENVPEDISTGQFD